MIFYCHISTSVRECWKDREHEIPVSLEPFKIPGKELDGCVTHNDSPGQMSRHMERKHPELVPKSVLDKRVEKEKSVETEHVDMDVTRDFVHDAVLRDLHAFRVSTAPGLKAFLKKHCKGRVGQKDVVAGIVGDIFVKGTQDVYKRVAKAKAEKSRISLSADTWKSKGSTRTHYLSIIATWVSSHWEQCQVCLGVVEMRGSKKNADHSAKIQVIPDSASLRSEDIMAFVTDHEGAIRKSGRALGLACVGCGCHALQLPIKHILPPLRAKSAPQLAPSPGPDSVSSSDSTEGDSSESVVAGASVDAAAPAAGASADAAAPATSRGRKRDRDPERDALIAELTPLFKKGRHLIRWYVNHDTTYNELMDVSAAAGLQVKRFARETSTRWNSSLTSQSTLLYNDVALTAFSAGRPNLPEEYSAEECALSRDVAGVFTPLAVGTRVLEKDSPESQVAHYMPMWHGVINALEPSNPRVPKPADAFPCGSDGAAAKYLDASALHTTAFLAAFGRSQDVCEAQRWAGL